MIITSGGLGPTADDLTAEVVGRFCGREMVLDERLEGLHRRDPAPDDGPLAADLDAAAIRAVEPQAGGDSGRRDRRWTRWAPRPDSWCRRSTGRGRPSSCCPGRRASCSRCGQTAVADRRVPRGDRGRDRRTGTRSCGCSGSPSRRSRTRCGLPRTAGMRAAELEITTCLRRGEIEIATRYEPARRRRLRRAARVHRASATATRCSRSTARRSTSRSRGCWRDTIAVAESCTGGMLAARLTDRAGSSAYFAGGVVVVLQRGQDLDCSASGRADRTGRARYRPRSRRRSPTAPSQRFGADVGVGITGVAGPDGGTEEKPVGLGVLLGRAARCRADHPQRSASREPRGRPRPIDHGRDAPRAAPAARRSDRPASGPGRRLGVGCRSSVNGDERVRLFVALELPDAVRWGALRVGWRRA